MNLWLRNSYEETPKLMDAEEFCRGGTFWQPVIVDTQQEKDYLMAMQLMVGKSFEVCLDGIDTPKSDTAPCWAHLPHL